MEEWDVERLYVEHENTDGHIDTITMSCRAVLFNPESSIAADTKSERGGLIAKGCDLAALSALTWRPTRLRFQAKRYVEDRLFEISGHTVTGTDEVTFWLPSLKGSEQSFTSDGNTSPFPVFK